MARLKRIIVERRWIASSNREWGVTVNGGWRRGGSLGDALKIAAEAVDETTGALVQVMPDQTGEQVKRAYEAVGWDK